MVQAERVVDGVAAMLEREGVEVVFTVPGGTAVPLLEAISRRPSIRVVVTKDEAGAAYAADGYAWATGKVGVIVTIGGPGATNTLTGLSCSAAQGNPICLLSGEVSNSVMGKRPAQDGTDLAIDVLAMSRPATALSAAVGSPRKAEVALSEALRRAVQLRRPVHLSLPLDVQTAPLRQNELQVGRSYWVEASHGYDHEAVARAASALRTSRRTALLVGNGARNCSQEVFELANTLQCPVATTCAAKGVFPEDHPLSLGVFSFGSGPLARAVFESGLEVLCAVGTGLGEFATLNYSEAIQPSRALIHVDTNPAVFGRSYRCLPVCGESSRVLAELNRELRDEPRQSPEWFADLRRREPLLEDGAAARSSIIPMRPERVMTEIGRVLPRDAQVVADIGTSCLFVAHYLKLRPPQRCYIPTAWSCMAHPLSAAIGVRLGSRRPTLCVTGDAAFLSKGLELHTAVENGVSQLVWVVLSNRGHGLVRLGTSMLLGNEHGVESGDFRERVDCAAIARAAGVRAERVKSVEQLASALNNAVQSSEPWLIDVEVDVDAAPPMADRIGGLTAAQEAS